MSSNPSNPSNYSVLQVTHLSVALIYALMHNGVRYKSSKFRLPMQTAAKPVNRTIEATLPRAWKYWIPQSADEPRVPRD